MLRHLSKRFSVKLASLTLSGLIAAVTAASSFAVDNGTQLTNPFRVNYAGYLPQASKIGIYVKANVGAINWSLSGTTCTGTSNTYVTADKSSGDSFYMIDFSACTQTATTTRLVVGADQSAPFDISANPYGTLKYTFFKYFKDHEATATFVNPINNWTTGLSLTFNYVRDAGDNGAYPVNTSDATWSLINLLETYPTANTYYSTNLPGARTVYDQLKVLTEQFKLTMNNPRNLAIPKFHTNVNATWAACAPFTTGTCISEPETKATFSTARAMAAMARMHSTYGTAADATAAYTLAKTALTNARTQPPTCNQATKYGGEGGMYPDNDNTNAWRNPKRFRDNCIADKNNTQDDEYEATVELYLAAEKLKLAADAAAFKAQVLGSTRFNEASQFWWGAVATQGSLSLLANQSLHTIDLTTLKANVVSAATTILTQQAKGYPGVTWDPNSTQWNSGDLDTVDNNVRWGSNRDTLNNARLLMAAAEIQKAKGLTADAARFARGAVKVLDYIFGINAVNLAMVTATGYPNIENAVTRTHDGLDANTLWAGKLANGPNNFTNADDPDMPAFGSRPGLKMFALTGTGWASREISIDVNGALVPVAFFSTEVAPAIMALDPIGVLQGSSSSSSSSSRSSSSSSKASSSPSSRSSSSRASSSSSSKASSSSPSSSSSSKASSSSSSKSSSSSSSSSSGGAAACNGTTFNKTAIKATDFNAVAGDCIRFTKVSGTLQIGSWSGKATTYDITGGPQGVTNTGAAFTPVAGVANGVIYVKVKTAPSAYMVKFDYW